MLFRLYCRRTKELAMISSDEIFFYE